MSKIHLIMDLSIIFVTAVSFGMVVYLFFKGLKVLKKLKEEYQGMTEELKKRLKEIK